MAAYPVNQGGVGCQIRVSPDAGIQFTPMSNGEIRGYSDYTEDVFSIEATHWFLVTTDRDAIDTFYEANRLLEVSIASNKGNYNAYFRNRPEYPEESGPYFMVVSRFVGVKV